MRGLALAVVLLSGCSIAPSTDTRVRGLDVGAYRELVHPIVRFSCASLDCHGVAGRPLRLYAEDGLRRSADLRGHPLSGDEAAENVAAFAGVDPAPASIEAHVALSKPVAGEVSHVGGDVWASREDPGYACVRAWLAGESDAPGVAETCSIAGRAVDPYPPDAAGAIP